MWCGGLEARRPIENSHVGQRRPRRVIRPRWLSLLMCAANSSWWGDRFHDLEVARVYGLNSVGCAYGFGKREEIADATVIVERPEDLLEGVRRAM